MKRTSTSFSIRKNNWGNKGVFPELVYLDTNVALDILEQRTYGKLAEEYLKELVHRDGMIVWSNHLLEELTDYFHFEKYTEEVKYRNIPSNLNISPAKWLENTATDSESAMFSNHVVEKVGQASLYLEQFGVQNDPDTKEVNDLTTLLYSNYGTNRKDSKHVAIANISGTNNIMTQDSGFLRYPSTNVFGASKDIVNNSNNIVNDPNSFIDLNDLFSKVDEDVS